MVRVKYRYFLLEIICEDFGNETMLLLPISSKDLYFAFENMISQMLGDYGIAVLKDGLTVKMLNPHSRIVYVRMKRGPHLHLAAVLPFITKIKQLRCSIRTLHIGGTLRCCHKYLQTFHHQQLPKLLSRCKSEQERQDVQDSIRSCLKES